MSGQIQIGGLATGLDTAAIIQALVGAEQIPIQQLEARQAAEQQKISLLGTFDGLLSDLRKKADEFKGATGFVSNSISIAQEGVASFSSTGGSALGTYSLNVLELASVDRFVSEGVASQNTPLDETGIGANFTFDGVEYDIQLIGEDASLANLAAEIEEQTGGDVRTTVVNVGTSDSPNYKLVVESNEAGVDNALEGFSLSSNNGSLDVEEQLSTASNAVIELNGLRVERETNDFSGVVEGLTFTVESLTTDGPVDFSVSVDEEGTLEKLKEFTDAYNAVVDFVNAQNEYSEEGGAGGPLFGDSILRSVSSAIGGSLNAPGLIDATSEFGSLGLLGVDLGTDGRLTVNESEVKEKLAEDPGAFSDYFIDRDGFDNGGAAEGTAEYYNDTTTDRGLFSTLVSRLDQLLDDQQTADGDKLEGLIDSRKDSLESRIKDFDKQIESLELRLESFEQTLVLQFAALEQLVSGLNSQGGALTSLNA